MIRTQIAFFFVIVKRHICTNYLTSLILYVFYGASEYLLLVMVAKVFLQLFFHHMVSSRFFAIIYLLVVELLMEASILGQ